MQFSLWAFVSFFVDAVIKIKTFMTEEEKDGCRSL